MSTERVTAIVLWSHPDYWRVKSFQAFVTESEANDWISRLTSEGNSTELFKITSPWDMFRLAVGVSGQYDSHELQKIGYLLRCLEQPSTEAEK